MICEDVSTLLFVLKKSVMFHVQEFLSFVFISLSFMWISVHVLTFFSLLNVLVLLEFCCQFEAVVLLLLFLCHLFSTSFSVGRCQVVSVFRQTCCFLCPLFSLIDRRGRSGSAAFQF